MKKILFLLICIGMAIRVNANTFSNSSINALPSVDVTAVELGSDNINVLAKHTDLVSSVPSMPPANPCPVVAFNLPTTCPSGDATFSWTLCNVDYDQNGNPDNYWTADFVEWNFGDGTTANSTGTNSITHTYTTADTVYVTAVVYLTGLSGELCQVAIANVDGYSDPCNLWNNPLIAHTFYDVFIPKIAAPNLYITSRTLDFCHEDPLYFHNSGQILPTPANYNNWSYTLFVDGVLVNTSTGNPTSTAAIYQTLLSPGDYAVDMVYTYSNPGQPSCSTSYSTLITITDCEAACDSCSSFKPYPNERFWVSAWVKEDHVSQQLTYDEAYISIDFVGAGTSVDFYPTGDIVEGWQRIVGSFTIPSNTTDLSIQLMNDNASINAYFDDIRIHPFNASMKSYVYDPETFWLTAELDDNNYATFYEYDKEGQLIRIKKETERGIMTIQESRSHNPKL